MLAAVRLVAQSSNLLFRRFSTFWGRQVFNRFDLPLLLLAGCSVGPDYHRPPPLGAQGLPPAFAEPAVSNNAAEWQTAVPAADRPRGPWWRIFQDSELNRLEGLASTNNQALAAAAARLAQARALVNVARADWFPQVEADPSYNRQRQSYNLPQNGGPASLSPTYNTFSAVLQTGWEADLWGRVSRAVESARARLSASADDLESARLALEAELAVDYFMLRALEAEEDVLRRSVAVYRRSLQFIQNRRRGGVVGDLDVAQAETQLKTAEGVLPALRLQRRALVHAVAVLCGQPATGFQVASLAATAAPPPGPADEAAAPATRAPVPPPAVPPSLPSELLERRPDIAAAEQRMASANAQIGVARSAFYPHLRFNGLAGFESIDASTWFNWPSRFWSVGPALQVPLFTGGRNRAQLALARAAYDETVANYRQTVLSAFQEVEDELAAQRLLAEQLEAELAALTAAQRTLEIANNRYKAGLVTYLEVATAQSAALVLERNVVQLRGQRLLAAVGLTKALGGGWASPGAQ